jgi:hypothetical protein
VLGNKQDMDHTSLPTVRWHSGTVCGDGCENGNFDTHQRDQDYACHHLKVASDRMKTWYDRLAHSTEFQEGDQVWLYH